MAAISAFFRCDGSVRAASLGFHRSSDNFACSPKILSSEGELSSFFCHNIAVLGSWIPGISILSGIYFNIMSDKLTSRAARTQNEEDKAYLVGMASSFKTRAIASFCQASVFLMLIDLIATAARFPSCCHGDD